MATGDLPRDKHQAVTSEQDATQRGTTQKDEEDAHTENPHRELPPVDPAFRPSDTGMRIDRLLREDKPRRRPQTLFPYLLVRAVPGDRGARPLWPPTVCWESCDIHLVPVNAGAFDFGKTVLQPVAGQTYRVFVHIWNLGRFAAFGGRLRVWWVEPGWFMGTSDPRYQPHFIGGAYFDLGDRDSQEAHRLVEVSPPWTAVMNNGGHECLIAAVECATDPWDGQMYANTHRHVAQRNVNLIAGAVSLTPLVSRLGGMMSKRETQLLITHSSISRTNFVGAHERGLARGREAPAGWDHSGLVFGNENRPIAAVRGVGDAMRFFDLTHLGRVPLPGARFGQGIAMPHGIDRELPVLLARTLGVRDLTGARIAAALTADGASRVLRFIVTDIQGRSMGYSVAATTR